MNLLRTNVRSQTEEQKDAVMEVKKPLLDGRRQERTHKIPIYNLEG
jgi:hypothetical protein